MVCFNSPSSPFSSISAAMNVSNGGTSASSAICLTSSGFIKYPASHHVKSQEAFRLICHHECCASPQQQGPGVHVIVAPPVAFPDILPVTDYLALPRSPDRWIVEGLLPSSGWMLLHGAPKGGKAMALDTPIPTPHGWSTMADLSVGDHVFGAD